MRKLLLAPFLLLAGFALGFVGITHAATILFPIGGGTGSSTLTGILIGNGSSPVQSVTIGSGLNLTGTTLTATGGNSSASYPFPLNSNATSTLTNFLGGIGATTIFATSTATSTIANLNTVLYVPTDFATNGCAGDPSKTEYGACVNALYAKLVAQNLYAGTIMVPAIKVTAAQWTTPVNFNGPTIVNYDGVRGATLIYGGTGTSTIFNMSNPTGHLVSDDYGILYQGNATLIAAGNANAKTTIGIGFGGSNGGVGINFHDNTVNGFGQNIEISKNAYMLTLTHNAISGGNGGVNGNLLFIDKANNSGERNIVDGNSFTDPGNSIATSSIYISGTGTASNFFTNNSFDDAGIFIGASNGQVVLNYNHFENAAFGTYGQYIPVVGVSSDSSTQITFNGNEIANDGTGINSFKTIIKHGGQLYAAGNHLDNYGGGTVDVFSDHSIDNGLESEVICQTQVQGGTLTNIIGNQAYSLAAGATCISGVSNSFPVSIQAHSNNVATIRNGNQDVGTFSDLGAWTLGTAANNSLITIQKNLSVVSAGTFGTTLGVTGVSTLTGGFVSAASSTLSYLSGTAAGSFIAVDPTGKIIATTTPAGGGGVSSVGANYPLTSTGGGSPVISIAFGTTTANSWSALQTFAVSPVFSTLGAGTVNSTAGGTIYNTATSTIITGSGLTYTGTLGSEIGGVSGTLSVSGLTTSNFASANVSQFTNDAGYITASSIPPFPFTPTTNFGINTNATSTPITFFQGIYASSTSQIASTTFAINGNVGIGTTSPSVSLDVGGYGPLSPNLTRSKFAVTDNFDGASGAQFYNSSSGTSAEFRFAVLDTNKTGYVTLDAPGNNNSASLFGNTRSTSFYLFSNAGSRNLTIGTVDAQALIFGTANTERLRISSAGEIKIATTTAGCLNTSSTGVVYSATCTSGTTYTGTFPVAVSGSVISSLFSTTTNSGMAAGSLYVGSGGVFQSVATTTLVAGSNVSFSGGTPVIFGSSPITINATGGSGAFAWTPTTNFAVNVNATGTPIWFQAGLQASSTSEFDKVDVAQSSTNGYYQGGAPALVISTPNRGTFLDTLFVNSDVYLSTLNNDNTFLGYNSGPHTVTGNGSGNTFVGSLAGSPTTQWMSSSTVVGSYAARFARGSNNTIFGAGAGIGLTTGGNNILIGSGVDALASNSTRTLDIGNLLYGSGVYNGATPSSAPVANPLLGIGTTTPFANFSIQANTADTNQTLFAIGSSTAAANTTLFAVNSIGSTTMGNFGACSGANALNTNAAGTIVCGATSGGGSVTAVTAGYPLASSGGATPNITTSFSTTTNNGMTAGLLYSGSGGIWQTAASSSLFGYTPLNPTRNINTTYPIQGGGDLSADRTITFGGLGTTTPWTAGQLAEVVNGRTIGGVSTSTLTASGPLTGSFTQIGSGGSLGCTTASAGVAGCLNSSDWSTFNNKAGFGWPFTPINATSVATTSGIVINASSTIGNGTQGNGLTISGGATTTLNASFLSSVVIGTSTGALSLVNSNTGNLFLYNTNTSGSSPALVMGGNAGGDSDFWFGRTNNNDTANNDSLQIGAGLVPGVNPVMTWTYQGREGIASTSPFAALSIHLNPTDLTAQSTAFAIGSSTATATTTLFSISNVGDVIHRVTNLFSIFDRFGTEILRVNTASTTGSIFTVAATTSPITNPVKLFDVDQYGHLTASSTGATITLGTCTGGATITAGSNDVSGDITLTTAVTSCAVVFAHAYATIPEVMLTAGAITAFPYVTNRSTTGFTINMSTAATGENVTYFVIQP